MQDKSISWGHAGERGGRTARKKRRGLKATQSSAGASKLKDLPVLVIDDDRASAKLMSVVLAGEGCNVRVTTSAEEALEALATFRPRLIVVDLILPLMSGLLFAQRLKADPAARDIVLVAVTAFNGREAERIALQAGFAAYVRKPVDPLSLIELLVQQLPGAS